MEEVRLQIRLVFEGKLQLFILPAKEERFFQVADEFRSVEVPSTGLRRIAFAFSQTLM
jgi:hypothetical protein